MATEYRYNVEAEDMEILNEALASYHQALLDNGVKVGLRMAWNADRPPVKHGGYPAAAVINPVPYKQRLDCNYDLLITIDEGQWKDTKRARKLALLDHELSHAKLRMKKNEHGAEELARDALGRPLLKMVPGDWASSDGFADVVKRHGEAAAEYQSAKLTANLVEIYKEKTDAVCE